MASDGVKWVPAKHIEEMYEKTGGNQFASINAPTAGPRKDTPVIVGPSDDPHATRKDAAKLQLYSLPTPNGMKTSIVLEELGVEYDAHVIKIGEGDQFTAGFVGANPNSKIPALVDHDGPGGEPLSIMESGAQLLYLADKFPEKGLLPSDPRQRSECVQWVCWQIAGQGPMTGNFGHFMVYAPANEVGARDYGVVRYGMEVQRLADVLNRHLEGYGDFKGNSGMRGEGPRQFLVGDQLTIADIACWPWVFLLLNETPGVGYNREGQPNARDFLSMDKYTHLVAWAKRLAERPAFQRGRSVCAGEPKPFNNPAKAAVGLEK